MGRGLCDGLWSKISHYPSYCSKGLDKFDLLDLKDLFKSIAQLIYTSVWLGYVVLVSGSSLHGGLTPHYVKHSHKALLLRPVRKVAHLSRPYFLHFFSTCENIFWDTCSFDRALPKSNLFLGFLSIPSLHYLQFFSLLTYLIVFFCQPSVCDCISYTWLTYHTWMHIFTIKRLTLNWIVSKDEPIANFSARRYSPHHHFVLIDNTFIRTLDTNDRQMVKYQSVGQSLHSHVLKAFQRAVR